MTIYKQVYYASASKRAQNSSLKGRRLN